MQTKTLSYGAAFLGLLIGAYSLGEYMNIRMLQDQGVEVPANLHHVVRYSSLRQNYFDVSYTFDHDGRQIRIEGLRVSVPTGRKLEAHHKKNRNATIDVFYLPSRPELSRPSAVVETGKLLTLPLVLALALILAPIGEAMFARKP